MTTKSFRERELLLLFRQFTLTERDDFVGYLASKINVERDLLKKDEEKLLMRSYRELTKYNQELVEQYCSEINIKQKKEREKSKKDGNSRKIIRFPNKI